MDANCGPSSALSQLNKHAQRDQTLQREFVRGQTGAQNGFQRPAVDNALNSDFSRFESGQFGGQFDATQFQGPNQSHHSLFLQQFQAQLSFAQGFQNFQNQNIQGFHPKQNQPLIQTQTQTQTQNQSLHQQGQSGWVDQFNGLSLHERAPDFRPDQFRHVTPAMAQGFAPAYAPRMAPQHSIETIRSAELEQDEIGTQFEQVEREMFESEQAARRAEQQNEDEKEQFAEAARAVKRLMILEKNLKSNDTSAKFEQLNFLKLMALILARQVEISSEGDKLVEREGSPAERMDDRAETAAPRLTRDMRPDWEERAPEYRAPDLAPDYHRPARESDVPRPRESESVRAHLPDPLAHIRDGGLSADLSPLQAARIVSGGQVNVADWAEDGSWSQPRNIVDGAWQEMYEDYRNDDDQ